MLMTANILALAGLSLGVTARSFSLPQKTARQTTACEHTATSRNCWGNYSIDTDYYDITPDTGVTREVCLSRAPLSGHDPDTARSTGSMPRR